MAGIIPFNRFNAIEDPTRYFDMMDDFFNFGNSLAHHSMQAGTFKMDVQDNKDAFVVEAELPGVDKDDINLEFNDDQLTIAVNHSEEKDDSQPEKNYVHRERRQVSMSRSVYLHDVNPDGITAKLDAGVLTVNVPKQVPVDTTKKIDIA
jgi:HSP20 family protein